VRIYNYHPRACRRLMELKATSEEFDSINAQVAELAKNPHLGYQYPFQTRSKKLFRFDVGRFGLIYTFNRKELYIITIV
jgi:mRNA-degrading endonuclease RelE of RelBE toxin-antitoxin system